MGGDFIDIKKSKSHKLSHLQLV